MGGDDWVEVRLSKFGENYACGTPLHVHEGHHEFMFTAGNAQRVTRAFDWERVLKNVAVAGQQLFELDDPAEAEVKAESDAFIAAHPDVPIVDVLPVEKPLKDKGE